jgi:DNA-binding transcriptional ArsR family regulator
MLCNPPAASGLSNWRVACEHSAVAKSATEAAEEIAALLDTPFLRALAEPARLEVLKVLLIHGSGDVASLAAHLPQDRSVISRHLQTLEEAGIVRSVRTGRHRHYALEGSALVGRFEQLSARVRVLAAICCPPVPAAPTSRTAAAPVTAASKPRRRSAR